MLFSEVVSVSAAVAATRSRLAKRDLIAELLRRASPDDVELATTYLSGTLRQRRTGVGWRGLASLPPAADSPAVTLLEIDSCLEELSGLSGMGSTGTRHSAVQALFARLTEVEQQHLRALMTGNVRQGALDSVVLDAVAAAAELPLATIRRAAMFSAPTAPIARAALSGGAQALAEFVMQAGRPVRPMLAGSAPTVSEGVASLRSGVESFAVDTKLDGIRIQVHRHGDEVSVFTRSLDEVSARMPDLVALVRALPGGDLVLDGEALTVDEAGRPRPFQDTASSTATTGDAGVRPFFFDLLLDGDASLVDRPAHERLTRLDARVPAELRVQRLVTDDPAAAGAWFDRAIAAGHEGVILKRLDAPYDAGRRGSAWIKVKPRHTLDLVVLAVEWGSGRRQGKLSNIHLGARTDDGFVMLGKTFKGMTDEMLAWQTERFLELETHRDGHVVFLHPEQVVEIAFDGVQRSTRYPGGVALRFARVLRYRDDKAAAEADRLVVVQGLLAGARD